MGTGGGDVDSKKEAEAIRNEGKRRRPVDISMVEPRSGCGF